MNLIAHIRTVIAYLRGSETVITQDFKLAIKALVEAGLGWWVSMAVTPHASAFLCPCDPDNNASCADWLEAQCRLCEGHSAAGSVGADGALPWNLLLPLLIKLLERFLG